MSEGVAAIVSKVIRDRRTVKVFADPPAAVAEIGCDLNELLDAASRAPFHLPAAKVHQDGALPSKLPWRFHLLDGATCRTLRDRLVAEGDKSKMPPMLGAATLYIQATWLPNPPKNPAMPAESLFEPTVENMELIAAASAAIQNLLLAATARGVPNYWSSGGVLRERRIFDLLGIPAREILLGGVFLFPPGSDGPGVATGKFHDDRGSLPEWTRWVKLD